MHIYNITEDENKYMKIILNNCGVKDDLNERRLRRSSFIYYNTVLLSWVKLNMCWIEKKKFGKWPEGKQQTNEKNKNKTKQPACSS